MTQAVFTAKGLTKTYVSGERAASKGCIANTPIVESRVSHFLHVPFRTSVKLPHSEQISPS